MRPAPTYPPPVGVPIFHPSGTDLVGRVARRPRAAPHRFCCAQGMYWKLWTCLRHAGAMPGPPSAVVPARASPKLAEVKPQETKGYISTAVVSSMIAELSGDTFNFLRPCLHHDLREMFWFMVLASLTQYP